jgi:catechol 2,3-dioxygenase-like lactoylglutathione lyase family enzyme
MELFEVVLTVDDMEAQTRFYRDVLGLDIEAERERLLASGVELGEIRSPADGVLVVDGRDPEGNPFHLEQRL